MLSRETRVTELGRHETSATAGSVLTAENAKNTEQEWREAQEKAAVCAAFLEVKGRPGVTLNAAAAAVGKSASWFSGADSVLARYQRGGVAGLLPRRAETGGKVTFTVPDWFVPAARFHYMRTNRTWRDGSVPEAVRRTISLPVVPPGWTEGTKRSFLAAIGLDQVPECPAELRERVLARERAGRPMVPERLRLLITAPETVVRQHRHPTNAGLDYLSAPGYSKFRRVGGEYEATRANDIVEPDDGTINFCVCVPWSFRGCKCSERWGVKVGRFQLLVMCDVASMFIGAYSYVMRPRSSYRQEDALTLYRNWFGAHGVPREVRHEGGVWNSTRVLDALKLTGAQSHRVHSPHAKPYIEGGTFNVLWTKLAALSDGQIGRFQDDMEAENDLLAACRTGSTDPRKHFPMLRPALACIDQAIHERNAQTVVADTGRWVPEERFEADQRETPPRRLAEESRWMLAPYQREWTVRGYLVGGKVPLFEDFSVPFDFTADWLGNYHGARVKCLFDPTSAARCQAAVVLAEQFGSHRVGELLGMATQVNGVADYARMVLGWGSGPDEFGRKQKQVNAAALRREVRTILPRGKVGRSESEERDGVETVTRMDQQKDGDTSPLTPLPGAERGTVDMADRMEEAERWEMEHEHEF